MEAIVQDYRKNERMKEKHLGFIAVGRMWKNDE